MKITVVGRQMNVSDAQKGMLEKKLAKFDKFFYEEGEATVTFSHKHNTKNLEVTISAANTLFRSEVEDSSFQAALDKAADTIERQIRRNKTRLEKRLKDTAFGSADLEEIPHPTDVMTEDYEADQEFKIRVKRFSFKPMSVEEAILQMNLLDHQFFVFEDSESGNICVVYARKDGNYGLIVPDTY